MSIGASAECYILDRSDMVTLPEYLHTPTLLWRLKKHSTNRKPLKIRVIRDSDKK